MWASDVQYSRKCGVSSGSTLHRGQVSLCLLPAVRLVVRGYLWVSSRTWIVAFLIESGHDRFCHAGCTWDKLHDSIHMYFSDDIVSASSCRIWVHLPSTAVFTMRFQMCLAGGFMSSSSTEGSSYLRSSAFALAAQLEECVSFIASCLCTRSLMNNDGALGMSAAMMLRSVVSTLISSSASIGGMPIKK